MAIRKFKAQQIQICLAFSGILDYRGNLPAFFISQQYFLAWLCSFVFAKKNFAVVDHGLQRFRST